MGGTLGSLQEALDFQRTSQQIAQVDRVPGMEMIVLGVPVRCGLFHATSTKGCEISVPGSVGGVGVVCPMQSSIQ